MRVRRQKCPWALTFLHKLATALGSWADSWRKSILEFLVHDLGKTRDKDGAVPFAPIRQKFT